MLCDCYPSADTLATMVAPFLVASKSQNHCGIKALMRRKNVRRRPNFQQLIHRLIHRVSKGDM